MDEALEGTNEILELNEYLAESNVSKLIILHEELVGDSADFIQQMEELLYEIL